MNPASSPEWFDRLGMLPWVEGVARGFRCRIELVTTEGAVLAAAGEGNGEVLSVPLEVNGRRVGEVRARPAERLRRGEALFLLAVRNLQSLAEARHTVSDLVRTTARQWRELSLLYRSTELLRGGLSPGEIARDLLRRALKAVRYPGGAVRYPGEDGRPAVARERTGDPPELPEELLVWAAGLEQGVIAAGGGDLRRLGYRGQTPGRGVVAVPLRSGGRSRGALILCAPRGTIPSAEELKLAGLLARQAAVAYENRELLDAARRAERLRRELEVAAEIQASILPEPHLDLGWLELAAACRPAAVVGGDAYLHRVFPGHGVCAGVADVSGHGISAAMLMNAFATAVLAYGAVDVPLPDMASAVNELLGERVGDSGMFVTAALLRLAEDGTLRLVNAGHPPVLVRRAGGVERVEAPDPPFAVLPRMPFRETVLRVGPGELVLAYSDGVTEAAGPGGELFGLERLEAVLGSLALDAPAGAVVEAVLEAVDGFSGDAGQGDDVTVLVMRRRR